MTTLSRKIVQNTSWLFLAEVIGNIFSFVLIVIIARYLGDAGLGVYSFAFAYANVFVLFTNFGMTTLMIGKLSKDLSKAQKYVNNISLFKFVLSAFVLGIAIMGSLFVNDNNNAGATILIILFAVFVYYFGLIFAALLQSAFRMEYEAIAKIAERFLALVLGWYLLSRGFDVVYLALVILVSHVSYFGILYLGSKQIVRRIKPEFDFKFWKQAFIEGVPFWFSIVFMSLYFQIDILMVSFLRDYAIAGQYGAANKLVVSFNFIPTVVLTVLFPAMSRLFHTNMGHLILLFRRAMKSLIIIILPIAFGTTLLAKRIILFMYGEQFSSSIILLKILIWAEAFLFIVYLLGFLLNAADMQKKFMYATGLGILLNMIINILLIPKFGAVGASIGTVSTAFCIFIMLGYYVRRLGIKLRFFRALAKPLIACMIMSILIFALYELPIPVLVPLSSVVYLGILYLFREIGREELDLLKILLKD